MGEWTPRSVPVLAGAVFAGAVFAGTVFASTGVVMDIAGRVTG